KSGRDPGEYLGALLAEVEVARVAELERAGCVRVRVPGTEMMLAHDGIGASSETGQRARQRRAMVEYIRAPARQETDGAAVRLPLGAEAQHGGERTRLRAHRCGS